MCGVIARWGPPGDLDEIRARIKAGLAAIDHRGPDGRGIWIRDGLALGHARLAVIDVEGGSQPVENGDGSIVAVVNGELYGFEAQRAELQARGHVFRTRSDSEVLVHLYAEYGDDCLRHLRGEFAFVLWDARQRRLLASRDRFGIKPLVWAQRGDELWFASEAKALFAAGLPAAWDATSVRQAMAAQYIAPARTLFRGVRELLPGTLLVAESPQRSTIRRGPALADVEETLAGLRDASNSLATDRSVPDVVDDIRRSLEDAVAVRLRADVPVAAYLSGGLDSSLVVALAAKHAPITAFGIAFDRAPYDEHRDAAAFAQSIGVPFHAVPVTQDAILEHLPDAVFHSEGLCINGQLTAKYLLSRAVRDAGFKVVLAGEGADEVFFGYAHLVREGLERAVAAGDRDAASQLAAHDAQHAMQAGIMLPLTRDPSLPVWLDAKRGIGRVLATLTDFDRSCESQRGATYGALAELEREPLTCDAPAELEREPLTCDALAELEREPLTCDALAELERDPLIELPADPLARSRDLWTRLALAKYILRTLGDGTEMAHGVEGRLPFLDARVVAAAQRAMPAEHLAGGVAKRLLREAARGLLPEALRARPKQPLLAPPITTSPSDLIRDVVRGSALRAMPWFDRDRVVAWVDAIPSLSSADQRAAEPVLMTILSACALQQRFRL